MKKNGLNRYVYDFFVDCNSFDIGGSIDIHKYLMKKNK